MPAITLPVPELPCLGVVVQMQTLLPSAAVELCSFCGELGHHHHPLEVYGVMFDHAAVIIREAA